MHFYFFTFLIGFLTQHYSIVFFSLYFVPRSVSVEVLFLCQRSKESYGLRKTERSHGRSATSFSGPRESTMSPKAKPRLVSWQKKKEAQAKAEHLKNWIYTDFLGVFPV